MLKRQNDIRVVRPFVSLVITTLIEPVGRRQTLASLLIHLALLTLTARLAHWPLALVLLVLLLISLPFTLYPHRHTRTPLYAYSPLFLLYAIAALRLLVALIARALCPACAPNLAAPQPFASLLSFEWAAVFCLAAIITLQASRAFPAAYHSRLAAFGLASLGALWAAILYPRLVPAGAAGADPYAYLQMAIDLAQRGTPLHVFPLATLAFDLKLPIYPTLPVGYTIPHDLAQGSATVWPPGFSALLAAAVKLTGERGAYWLNPILSALSLCAAYLLSHRLLRLPPFFSVASSVILLTSLEQTTRLSVPLADLAAQLFTTLALIAALARPPQRGIWSLGFGVLTALFAGFTYLTRYTQLLILPGLLYILNRHRETRSLTRSALFVAVFAIVTLPDFFYRAAAFGSPFAFAAGELAQFSAADILPVTIRSVSELAADFNLAFPFIVFGAYILFRRQKRTALGIALTLGPAVLFHLPYHYLKLRDLLFLLPTLCALAAFGLHRLYHILSTSTLTPSHLRAAVPAAAFTILFALFAFRWNVQRPLLEGFYTYGFLSAEQRGDLESIARLTPPNAVVASSLNSGAVTLYAQREAIRPGRLLQPGRTWTDDEFLVFVRALRAQGRPLYLLMDSEEMIAPAEALAECCALAPVAQLYLPYYYRSGAASNELVPLYRVEFVSRPR